jgi:hypothetical protein
MASSVWTEFLSPCRLRSGFLAAARGHIDDLQQRSGDLRASAAAAAAMGGVQAAAATQEAEQLALEAARADALARHLLGERGGMCQGTAMLPPSTALGWVREMASAYQSFTRIASCQTASFVTHCPSALVFFSVPCVPPFSLLAAARCVPRRTRCAVGLAPTSPGLLSEVEGWQGYCELERRLTAWLQEVLATLLMN